MSQSDIRPALPRLAHSMDDYRNAPSGFGPLKREWRDKPHRLVYDLVAEIERLCPLDPKPSTSNASTSNQRSKMNIVALDVDPAKVSVRTRDTELLPTPRPPSEWSAPYTIAEMLNSPDGNPVYNVAFLAVSQIVGVAGALGTKVVVTVEVADGDKAVRNIDYEITLTS